MKQHLSAGYQKRRSHYRRITIFLFLCVSLLCFLELIWGSISYPLTDVLRVLMGEDVDGVSYAIKEVRLPRMSSALLSGFAFGISGYLFQTLLHNPLASPDVIGISAGTSTSAIFFLLILGMRGSLVPMMALLFGLMTALLIYKLSIVKGHFVYGRLILIGIAISAFLRSVTSYLLAKGAEYDVGTTLRWLSGSLNSVDKDLLVYLFIVVFTITLVLLSFQRHLEVIPLGDDFSKTLGLPIKAVYGTMILLGVFLISFATSITGPIASISFLSGPIAHHLVGRSRSILIPSGLVGSLLTLGADLLAFHAFPVRYPVGVLTGLLGAPYMIYLLIRIHKRGGSQV